MIQSRARAVRGVCARLTMILTLKVRAKQGMWGRLGACGGED